MMMLMNEQRTRHTQYFQTPIPVAEEEKKDLLVVVVAAVYRCEAGVDFVVAVSRRSVASSL